MIGYDPRLHSPDALERLKRRRRQGRRRAEAGRRQSAGHRLGRRRARPQPAAPVVAAPAANTPARTPPPSAHRVGEALAERGRARRR